jgi:phosphoglycerate dehydrogenase-like enzyme
MKKLAILDDYEQAALGIADWSPLGNDVDISVFHDVVTDTDALVKRLEDFEILFLMRERTAFPRALLERLPKLEFIVTSGMRNAAIDMAAAKDCGVVVTGTPILPYPAAEHTWSLILALFKRIPQSDADTRAGRWSSRLNIGLKGKTLGIVGLGKLGAQVARVAAAFDMHVIAWSQNLTAERCAEVGVEYVAREALFENADAVTIHLQLGERNRGLITEADFERMKPEAFLINTSRGPIVDETALIRALQRGRIAGAGLDVYDVEPLPADHALRRLPNTVVTPHQGYVTLENYRQFYESAVDNIKSWLEGKPINVLN